MRFLIVEDDASQRNGLVMVLSTEFPGSTMDVLASEADFRSHMPEIERNPPDIILLDVMVRWTNSSPNMEKPPQEIKEEGYFRAGVRNAKYAREHNISAPIILYTILENEDLSDDPWINEAMGRGRFYYVRKEPGRQNLIDQIRSATEKN